MSLIVNEPWMICSDTIAHIQNPIFAILRNLFPVVDYDSPVCDLQVKVTPIDVSIVNDDGELAEEIYEQIFSTYIPINSPTIFDVSCGSLMINISKHYFYNKSRVAYRSKNNTYQILLKDKHSKQLYSFCYDFSRKDAI